MTHPDDKAEVKPASVVFTQRITLVEKEIEEIRIQTNTIATVIDKFIRDYVPHANWIAALSVVMTTFYPLVTADFKDFKFMPAGTLYALSTMMCISAFVYMIYSIVKVYKSPKFTSDTLIKQIKEKCNKTNTI